MQPTEEESSISPEPPVFEKPEESAAAEPELQKTEEIWAEPEKAEADMAPLEQPLPAELPPEPEQKRHRRPSTSASLLRNTNISIRQDRMPQ